MSTMGTFDGFTTARLGIYAAQLGLTVTGNNVSNINTEGYTRQRIDQVSFKAGAYDRYRSQLDNHVGSGALVMNINQIRDPYLDVRFRNTSPDVYYNDTMLDGLQRIAKILDEIGLGETPGDNEKGDGILYAQIQDLSDKLRAYASEPTIANNDLVRTSASILCGLFNKYASRLDTIYQETKEDFSSQVTKVNECLTNIRDLNREIRDCEIYGDTALELRDERNRQIDELSKYIHVKVVYTEEDIGCGQMVEKLNLYLDNDNPDDSVHTDESLLVSGIYGAQFVYPEKMPKANADYDPEFDPTDPTADPLGAFLYQMTLPAGEDDPRNPGTPLAGELVWGTNDPSLADEGEVNDRFMLQISKLVDSKDREWKDSYSNYTALNDATKQIVESLRTSDTNKTDPSGWEVIRPATTSVYSFQVSKPKTPWEDGDKLEISGNTYTIGTDIPADNANDPEKLAKFIAEKLGPTAIFGGVDYTISYGGDTADGDPTKIIYTAQTAGAIPVNQRPTLEPQNNKDGKLNISDRLIETQGRDAELKPPADKVDDNPDDPFGTITRGYRFTNGEWQAITTVTTYTHEVALDDNDLYGSLQATRELLTEKGEFSTEEDVEIDENAAKKRGIPYYIDSFNLLAKQFAAEFNTLNKGYALDEFGAYVQTDGFDEDGNTVYKVLDFYDPQNTTLKGNTKDNPLTYYEDLEGNYLGINPPADYVGNEDKYKKFDVVLNAYMTSNAKTAFDDYFKTETNPKDPAGGNYEGLDDFLKNNGAIEMGGNLFSHRNDQDDDSDITALNISVSQSWSTNDKPLIPKFEVLFYDGTNHSTQNINANHMINLIEKDLLFNPKDLDPDAISGKLFVGNFNEMFNNMNTILGQDIRHVTINLNSSYGMLVEIDTQRDGVSGVDLNDEAMNMMQYQKAMNAAMRMMTTIDEALDRLINNTGIAGR